MYVKRVGIFLIIAALIAGMVGCTQPAQYNLTIFTTEGGEITTPDEETSSYDVGTVVPLVVFPHTGYRFVNWTGNVGAVANINSASTTITMNGDYSVTANFEEMPQYDLTISSTTGGSVTTPGEGTFTYDVGEVVNLVAVAEEGYYFINWSGDVGSVAYVIAATTTVTMNADYSIMANFEEGVATFPNPNVGAAIRGDIRERGYLFPSDVQGHNPFH